MKQFVYTFIVLVTLVGSPIAAQEKNVDLFTVPLSNPSAPGKLVVDQISGSINVVIYEGKEVVVKATIGDKDHCDGCHEDKSKNKDKAKSGMKKISGSSLKISAEEKNNVVEINNELWNRTTDLFIKVPKNFSLKLATVNNGNISVTGVNGDMEISNVNGEIKLKDVSGSASLDTTNGDVQVNFTSIKQGADMAFSTFNGDVNVTFPSTLKANIKAKSDMGDVYTDFDMAVAKNEPQVDRDASSGSYKVKIEQWVKGSINGGGPEMLFKTFNGDVIISSK